jgi:hypothetical protein
MNINVADLIGEVKGMDEEDLIISEAMDAETLDDIIEEVKDRPSVAYQTDILSFFQFIRKMYPPVFAKTTDRLQALGISISHWKRMVEMERDNEQGPEDLYIEVCGKGLSRITIGTAPAEYEYYLRTDRASEMRTCLIAWSNVLYGALGDDLIPLDAEVVVRMAENIRSVHTCGEHFNQPNTGSGHG